MNIADAKKIISASKPLLAERFFVREIGVFGSFSRGEQNDSSDVDILVAFDKPVGFFKFLDLEEYLSSILGRKVDLVTRQALKPNIGRNILKDLVTV